MVKSIARTAGCQIMGSAMRLSSLVPLRARIELRSLQYHREFWSASSAAATPCTAVPTRLVLMKVNLRLEKKGGWDSRCTRANRGDGGEGME